MPKTKTTENSLLLQPNTVQLHSSWVSVNPTNNENDNQCYMCLQGGQLVLCDFCPRCVCMRCLVIPSTISFRSNTTFLCLLCHEKTFYGKQPYYGFYTTARKPFTAEGNLNPKSFSAILTTPLQVRGDFQLTAHSRMSSEKLLMVHFVLDGMSVVGSPCHGLAEYIRVFRDSTNFHFEEIVFNFASDVLKDNHRQKLQMLSRAFSSISGRVMIFVTTRCEQDMLYFSTETKAQVEEFFDILLPSTSTAFLNNKDTTMFLLSGGSAFQNEECSQNFSLTMNRLNLSHFVTFIGTIFHPCQASRFLLGIGQHFLLEDLKLSSCFERLLPIETSLCRQTDIIYIWKSDSAISGSRYSWSHEEVKPWGQELPVQCRKCGSIRNWLGTKTAGKRIFICKTEACETKLDFSAPKGMKWIGKSALGGRWLFVDINIEPT